jgi:sulfate transport system substrate-binding protein
VLAVSLAGCGGNGTPQAGGAAGGGAAGAKAGPTTLLLVSYSVTKRAYDRILPLFEADWKRRTGQEIRVRASYGGSSSQTRAVIDGLEADVVTLALPADVLKLEKAGLVQPGWEKELPSDSTITHSVVTLLTRAGNPKAVRGWSDLARPGLSVITTNPKTSGGARWNVLGLWGSVTRSGGSDQAAETFVGQVLQNVQNLPKDAREASEAFLNRGQGDVLLTYENEALLAARQDKGKGLTLVVPTLNIRIDGPVAVVDRTVDRRNSRRAAEALATYLQGEEAQEILAGDGFRPVNAAVWKRHQADFAPVSTLFSANDLGGWPAIERRFFASGGLWDKIAAARRP